MISSLEDLRIGISKSSVADQENIYLLFISLLLTPADS